MAVRCDRHLDRIIASALFVITVLLYARSFGYGFVTFDDPHYVVSNENLRQGLGLAGLRWAMTTFYFANWHPLVWVVYLTNAALFHSRPWPLHVFNAVVHATNAVLLWLVLQQMTARRWCSAIAAALFAWHPLRVESVVWISETKDVLAGLFWMLTLLAYRHYVLRPGAGRYLLVLLAFGMALMSKPTVVTLPGILLLLDFWPLCRFQTAADFARRVVEKVPLLVMAGAASVLYLKAQREGGALISPTSIPFPLRLQNAIVSVAHYLADTFWPARLCALYPHPFFLTQRISPASLWMASFGLLLITVIAVGRVRRSPYLLVGWLWFLAALLPASGLFAQAGLQSRADRYTYLPSIGLTILVVWSAADLLALVLRSSEHSFRIGGAITAATCLALLIASTLQIRYWHDTWSLFWRADQVTDRNFFAKSVLATEATRAGKTEVALNYGRAAVEICGGLAQPHAAFGAALLQADRPHDAYLELLKAASHDPYNGRVRDDLGHALVELNHPIEAAQQFEFAVHLNPGFAEGHSNWAVLLASQGNLDEAMAQWRLAISLDPSFGPAQGFLATALQRRGDRRGAVEHFRAALADGEHRPEWSTNLAWLLATDPRSSPEEITEAVSAAHDAVITAQVPDPLAFDALAAAEARDDQFDRAIADATTAVKLAAKTQPRLATAIASRLHGYQMGRAYTAE